jgi:hypothetical protein
MYYPKSEITPNLTTTGNEFILVGTGEYYKGPYYATSDGKFYTGLDYSPSAQEIKRPTIGNIQSTTTSPTHYTPQPTDTDYTNGFFIRYVIKRVNSGFETIKEVSESDFNAIQANPLYNTTSFKWKLTGKLYDDLSNMNQPVYGIIHTNRRTLMMNEIKIPGISKFFVNLAQYSK